MTRALGEFFVGKVKNQTYPVVAVPSRGHHQDHSLQINPPHVHFNSQLTTQLVLEILPDLHSRRIHDRSRPDSAGSQRRRSGVERHESVVGVRT
jgi:hypothetical protein